MNTIVDERFDRHYHQPTVKEIEQRVAELMKSAGESLRKSARLIDNPALPRVRPEFLRRQNRNLRALASLMRTNIRVLMMEAEMSGPSDDDPLW